MFKYLRIYRIYLSKNIKSRLSYRLDTVIGIFGFLLENLILFSTLYLTISVVPSLYGWDTNMLGFLYGFYLIPKSIDHIFTDEVWQLSNGGITRGLLDKYLTRPLNPLFQLIAERLQFEGFGEFILGIILLLIFTPLISVSWTFLNVLALFIAMIFAAIFFFSIKLIMGSLSFWTKRSIQFMTLVYDFSNFAKYPIHIFNQVVKTVLLFIIPFSVVLFLPVEALIFSYNIWLPVLYSGIASVVALTLSLIIWNQGLKRYESAGS